VPQASLPPSPSCWLVVEVEWWLSLCHFLLPPAQVPQAFQLPSRCCNLACELLALDAEIPRGLRWLRDREPECRHTHWCRMHGAGWGRRREKRGKEGERPSPCFNVMYPGAYISGAQTSNANHISWGDSGPRCGARCLCIWWEYTAASCLPGCDPHQATCRPQSESPALGEPHISQLHFPRAELSLLPGGGVCDQKTSKFFVSHGEESVPGQVGINRVY
jgi:hypothetical protein